MSQYFQIHPDNPQHRLIFRAVEIIREGGVVVYPTDSSYAIGCHLGDKQAMERIRRIRKLDPTHNFTLMCRDLSEIATYAKVDNPCYRLIKSLTPGPYTFILPATHEVPRRLQHAKRKTIGLRIPDEDLFVVEGTGVYSWQPGPDQIIDALSPGQHQVLIRWRTLTGLADEGEYSWTFRAY